MSGRNLVPHPINAAWRAANRLPEIGGGLDKEARGRVLLVGGSAFVPGAVRLTGEALLRAGAGKIQLATIAAAALAIGIAFPEAAVIALPADAEGEIAGDALAVLAPRLERCDALLLGPAMMERPQTPALIGGLIAAAAPDAAILLDAGALTAMRHAEAAVKARGGRVVLTPHHGELAALLGMDKDEVAADPAGAARDAASRFDSVVVLKSAETLIAAPDGTLLHYQSGAPGLGTAGSGDVLAGVIGGLLARGAAAIVAAGWGVWLHGEAGRAAGAKTGPLGYLARDLAVHVPGLMVAD